MSLSSIQNWLEATDLGPVFIFACISGVFLTVYLMQATWLESDGVDAHLVRQIRRFSQFLISASLLWCVNYAYYKSWQPWPPMVALILSFNIMMFSRALSVNMRRRSCEPDSRLSKSIKSRS